MLKLKRDINQIIRDTLLLLPKAVTEQILDLIHGREPNMHHQEASIVEPSICESIKERLEEELHSHCLIDDNLSQYPTYPNLDSDLDHITAEEEKVEINQTSVEEQSCGHSVIEEHACKRDRETETELIDVFPYLELKEEQSHDDTIVSELDQEHCNEDLCPSSINRILHPILNQNMLVQCVDTDLVSNLEITPGINLKALSSHQILRSIIPRLGENFQSTLPSQLFKSYCMGLSFN